MECVFSVPAPWRYATDITWRVLDSTASVALAVHDGRHRGLPLPVTFDCNRICQTTTQCLRIDLSKGPTYDRFNRKKEKTAGFLIASHRWMKSEKQTVWDGFRFHFFGLACGPPPNDTIQMSSAAHRTGHWTVHDALVPVPATGWLVQPPDTWRPSCSRRTLQQKEPGLCQFLGVNDGPTQQLSPSFRMRLWESTLQEREMGGTSSSSSNSCSISSSTSSSIISTTTTTTTTTSSRSSISSSNTSSSSTSSTSSTSSSSTSSISSSTYYYY